VWFLLGYALWSVAYGALGALASRSEDAQAVSAPATIVLVAVYVFALTALYDPDSLSSRVASLIPVTAPLVMPIRIARGEVALWEVALALALTAAAIYALVRLGGRVYAGAVLRTGAKVRLRDAWRFGGPDIAGRATSRAGTGG
jgi:ABC-2 type transport system permease protein